MAAGTDLMQRLQAGTARPDYVFFLVCDRVVKGFRAVWPDLPAGYVLIVSCFLD